MPCRLIIYKGLLTQYFSGKLTVDLSISEDSFNKIFGITGYFPIRESYLRTNNIVYTFSKIKYWKGVTQNLLWR